MAARAGTDAFQDIDEGDQVAGDIFVRAGQRAPYPGLRGEMNHSFKVAITEEAFGPRAVGKIQGKEQELRSHAELPQARVFQPGVVVALPGCRTPYDFKPIREEPVNQMRANKTGGARDQNSFFFCFIFLFLTDRRLAQERAGLSKLPLRLTPRWRYAPGCEDRAMETSYERSNYPGGRDPGDSPRFVRRLAIDPSGRE